MSTEFVLILLCCLSLLAMPYALRQRWKMRSVNRITLGMLLTPVAALGAIVFHPDVDGVYGTAVAAIAACYGLGEIFVLIAERPKVVPVREVIPVPIAGIYQPPVQPKPKASLPVESRLKYSDAARRVGKWRSQNRGRYTPM